MTATPAWRNWARDQGCAPAEIVRPSSRAEVAEAVGQAARAGRTVRVAGAGHSFSDAVLTEGTLLSLDRLHRVLDVDAATGLVKVEAGITLNALNAFLWQLGLAFENLGDIDVQSIAGATATGTHGTGGRLPNLSAGLHAVELVLADGSTLEVSEHEDADAWRAARVSVGALGAVTAVTLRTVPAFVLEGVDAVQPLDGVVDRLDELVADNDHFEFFTFPHSSLALTRTNNRVAAEPDVRSARRAWIDDILVRNHLFHAACAAGRAAPSLIPHLNRLVSRMSGTSRRRDRSYRIFASPRLVRFTEMEYAIPRVHAREAVLAVRELIARRGFTVPFPLEVRFVASDDAFLSPAAGRDTCYVAVHMYRGMEWEPYFRAVEEIMDGFDGRPHWGKRHFQTARTLSARYPEWDRFQAVRARLDPDGRFANDYVRRTLGTAEGVEPLRGGDSRGGPLERARRGYGGAMRRVDHLIVGGGIAGASCAQELRERGAGGAVTVVARELDPPYHRPPCTKEYLRGEIERDAVYIEPADWYAEHDIQLLTRTSVLELDTERHVAKLSTKEEVEYGSALVATGAMVRRLNVDGSDLDGIHYIRAPGNSDGIRKDLQPDARVLLVGGSYIGCEVAASLTKLGHSCTVLMLETLPMERGFGQATATFVRDLLAGHGITFVPEDKLERFEGADGRVARAVTAAGRTLDADLVVIGAGVMPDVMLGRKSGLEIGESGGLVCDGHLRTSAPDVYAAGDICEFDSVLHGRRVRIEHEEVARTQGAHVARAMLGDSQPYAEAPYFWCDLADWATLEYVGLAGKADAEEVDGDPSSGSFAVRFLVGGRLDGVVAVERPDALDEIRRQLAGKQDPLS